VGALEVLFTGSVPLQPAAEVFRTLQRCCGGSLRRMPDGEQLDWVFGAWNAMAAHPALEVRPGAPAANSGTPFGGMQTYLFALRDGATPKDLQWEKFGVADTVAQSYRELTELVRDGIVDESVRLQATIAGPGTTGGPLLMPWQDVVSVVNPPLIAEIEAIAAVVPAHRLAVQFDLAAEIELEELRRNPSGFDAPAIAALDQTWSGWTLDTLLDASVELADHVPAAAELGFHLCGLWHMEPAGGQDVRVQVDAANLLTEKVGRRIDYIHLPMLPQHGPKDYAALADLRLDPKTKLFLGLIHRTDGSAGARRRIELASAVVQDFGVAYFCGLRDLNGVGTEALAEVLDLHSRVVTAG
jgi:hypothetical protein